MRFYTEGRIAEEQRIKLQEENEHIRQIKAGHFQTHRVWKDEAEREKWEAEQHRWMTDSDYRSELLDALHQRMKKAEEERMKHNGSKIMNGV
jgi:hypothetical protein